MRHLEVQSLFVKEAVRKKRIRLVKETSQKNVSDVFAKNVDGHTLARHLPQLGVQRMEDIGVVPPL
eukprot:10959061-Alexandrium_andersonii.AAC.1